LHKAGVDLTAADDNGATALTVAAARGNTHAIDALREAGVDLTAPDAAGLTAATAAAANGQIGTLLALAQRGVDLTAPDINGNSPLAAAVAAGHERAAAFLRQYAEQRATPGPQLQIHVEPFGLRIGTTH
jgi:ankyrin repeat protein